MRALVEAEKGGEGPWDLKQAPGGVVDIEFVAQYLQLLHAAAHPSVLSVDTETSLIAAARESLLPAAEADILLPAHRLYQNLSQVLRLSVESTFRPDEAPRGLLRLLARAAELPDFATLDAHLRETEAAVRKSFERLVGKVPRKPKG
jgi:glutamate-ammonia-ligase adenylyltransferase